MGRSETSLAVSQQEDGVLFWIHVSAGARRPSLGGVHGDALRVCVTAPPVGGGANRACALALAQALEVRLGEVTLNAASRGRRKRVRISGDPGRLSNLLAALAGS